MREEGRESVVAVWDLLHAGDWACANADDEALMRVAGDVSRYVGGVERDLALRVVRSALRDLSEASRAWSDLSEMLRAEVSSRPTA